MTTQTQTTETKLYRVDHGKVSLQTDDLGEAVLHMMICGGFVQRNSDDAYFMPHEGGDKGYFYRRNGRYIARNTKGRIIRYSEILSYELPSQVTRV